MTKRAERSVRAAHLSFNSISRACVLGGLWAYRHALSPLMVAMFGPACRFTPSCSEYAESAIARYGLARGGWLTIKRLLRCRPGGGWGYDPIATNNSDESTSGLRFANGWHRERSHPGGVQ